MSGLVEAPFSTPSFGQTRFSSFFNAQSGTSLQIDGFCVNKIIVKFFSLWNTSQVYCHGLCRMWSMWYIYMWWYVLTGCSNSTEWTWHHWHWQDRKWKDGCLSVAATHPHNGPERAAAWWRSDWSDLCTDKRTVTAGLFSLCYSI